MIILFDTNLTLKFINMQHSIKTLLAVLAIAVASTFTSCYSPIEEDAPEEPSSTTRSEVLIRHNVFDFQQGNYDATRAALSDASSAKILAISTYIYGDENTVAYSETQYRKDYTSNPEEFGVVKTALPAGTYSLVSVGYECDTAAAKFTSPEVVQLPTPLIDAWSATESFTLDEAGSKDVALDLKLAVTHAVITSTDFPTADATYVRIKFSKGHGRKFNPYTQASINTRSDGSFTATCTIANSLNSDGKFVFDRSFFIPTTPTDITVSYDILDANEAVLRSYTIGEYPFKRSGINRFTGPVFEATGAFTFTATTNWEEYKDINF